MTIFLLAFGSVMALYALVNSHRAGQGNTIRKPTDSISYAIQQAGWSAGAFYFALT